MQSVDCNEPTRRDGKDDDADDGNYPSSWAGAGTRMFAGHNSDILPGRTWV
jgi:hypothetical protein